MTTNNIQWAAGVLSVRGSFNHNKNSVYIRLVQNYCDDTVQNFYDYFGGRKHGLNHQHIWHLCGDSAIGLMMTIYDLMPTRRQEVIKKCIEVWKNIPKRVRVYKKKEKV